MSFDVIAEPFWSFSPSLSVKVQVLPPSDSLPESVARSPTTVILPSSSSRYWVRPRWSSRSSVLASLT